MEFGAHLDTKWLSDFGSVTQAAVAFEEGGIDFVTHGGHVLTAAANRYPDRPGPSYSAPYRDPFVLYTHLAAKTTRLRFRSAIMILPMFPTVLVAKQAADLSIVSGGRYDLGVGISWQEAEYKAMGHSLRTRGARFEEQIEVLRLLWSEPRITFHGRFHDIDDLGVAQTPPRIPIWIGSGEEPVRLERVARLGDGWIPPAGANYEAAVEEFAKHRPAGQPPVQISARLSVNSDDPTALVEEARKLTDLGVSALWLFAAPGSDVDPGIAAILATREAIASAVK